MVNKKKNAVMLADTRPALVGTVMLQLKDTNPGLFDEAIIYYTEPISPADQALMSSIMPCRFVKYDPPLPDSLFKKPRFKMFSILMFARYEMFSYLDEFETITWLDTDILIQGNLSGMLEAAKKTGAAFIREDPENKTAEQPDRMRTCFTADLPGYRTDEYLYCSGTIVLTDKIFSLDKCTRWCYEKTIQWADILSLPDQGVINAAIQTFNMRVTPIPGKIYCCYPYKGRDCSDASIIHAWGLNKFWNDWYVYQHYAGWRVCYESWRAMGGCGLDFEIKPRISVVIPSFKPNTALFRLCLDSLMTQKRAGWERFSDFEIIIIAEPFEQEPLRELVASYHDKRIRLEFNEERLGIAASLNRGIRLAQGKYIARMDDDDLAGENRLFLQSEYLDKNPNITLCTSDFEYFGDMNERRLTFEGEMDRAWSIFTCPFDHPTIMFCRNFFVDNRLFYDEQRGYVEDWELWLRAFDKGMTVGCIHEVLFYHRWIHNGSAGQTNKTVEMMRELIQRNFRRLDVEIATEDLALVGPWNGRITNEGHVEKLEGYFNWALKNNKKKRLYDQTSLEKVFNLRLEEAKTGTLPGLVQFVERQEHQQNETDSGAEVILPNGYTGGEAAKPSILRRCLKAVVKPLYRPFRHRYEDRVINIQESGWAIAGHVLNCITKLDQLSAAQVSQVEQILAAQSKQTEQILAAQANQTEQIQLLTARLDAAVGEINGKLTNVGDRLYDLSRELRFEQSFLATERLMEKKAVLIGTPEHSNIGDAAITVGEMEFIRRYFPDYRLVELSTYDFKDWYDKLISLVSPDDILFLQGGGNLGNKYLSEENVRRRVIADFPSNRVVIFPQTIYFENSEEGLRELTLSETIYNRHKNLTIFTRGAESLAFAQMHFSGAHSVSALDLALMMNEDFGLGRNGLLLCIRDINDESGLTAEQYAFVVDTVKKLDPGFLKTNNLNRGDQNANIYKDMRRSVVKAELKKFAEHKVVVTDRLHGLILSIITHTPCVVLSSYNRKIAEFCTFFNDSNAVFFLDRDLDSLENTVNKALAVETPSYPILEDRPFEEIYRSIVGEHA